jgi:ankyrin repeat protein
MSIVVSSVKAFYFMRPGRFQEMDPSFTMILRYLFLLTICIGTPVYVITLFTCINPAFFLLLVTPIIPLILFKPKATSIANRQKEEDDFYTLGFMSTFVPIWAWTHIDIIPRLGDKAPKRPNEIAIPKRWDSFEKKDNIWLLPFRINSVVLIMILLIFTINPKTLLQDPPNNGLLLLQCLKNDPNNSLLGYRTFVSKNTSFFSFFDIGIQICSDDICLPAIRVCAENEEPSDKLQYLFFPIEQTLYYLTLIIFLTRNKYRMYWLRKKICCCSTAAVSFDLFQYCARNMKTSNYREEMLHIFNQAVEHDKNIINQKDNLYGETCAFQALDAEDYGLLETILDLGGNLFLYNNNGENVFSLLKKKFEEEDDTKIQSKIKHVLENTKVQENRNNKGDSRLSCCSKSLSYLANMFHKCFPNLFSKNYEIWREQPMHKCVRKNLFGKLIFFALIGGNWNAKDHLGKTVFEYLFEKITQNENAMKLMSRITKRLIFNASDSTGQSLIHKAVKLNSQECLQILIDNKVDVNTMDFNKNWTPLHYATHLGFLQCAKFLIENGASVDAQDFLGQTPLFLAIEEQTKACVQLLIDNGANVNAKDKKNQTLLHILGLSSSSSEEERKEILSFLINCSAEFNAIDKEGNSVLHNMALKAQPTCLKFLIDKGVDVKAENMEGETPLFLVSRATVDRTEDREKCIKYLIEAGADVNAKDKAGNTILHYLAFKAQAHCLKLLVDKGANVNAKTMRGETPLHLIGRATFGSTEDIQNCIDYLIEAGADINAKEKSHCSPIYNSIVYTQPDCLKLLIEKGADVNDKTIFGITPLHAVGLMTSGSKEEREKCVEHLIEAGADVNARCWLCCVTPKCFKIVRNYIRNHPKDLPAASDTTNDSVFYLV